MDTLTNKSAVDDCMYSRKITGQRSCVMSPSRVRLILVFIINSISPLSGIATCIIGQKVSRICTLTGDISERDDIHWCHYHLSEVSQSTFWYICHTITPCCLIYQTYQRWPHWSQSSHRSLILGTVPCFHHMSLVFIKVKQMSLFFIKSEMFFTLPTGITIKN